MKAFFKGANFGISMLLVAVAIGLAYIAIPAFGNKALIVRSGSMSPAIKTGDLIVIKAQTTYRNGDIIAFKDSTKPPVTITHRIIGQQTKDGQIFYKTRGDANNTEDFNFVPKSNIIGKADFGIKGIGKIFAFTKTKAGFFAFVIGPALLVILFELVNIIKEVKKSKAKTPQEIYRQTIKTLYANYGKPMGLRHPSTSFASLFHLMGLSLRGSKRRSNLSFRSVLPFAATLLLIGNTFSYFSDTATSTNNIFTAGQFIADTLVINEILFKTDCSNPGNKQWIELWNGSSSTVNLKDWNLRDQDNNTLQIVNSNTNLDPGKFALLSKASATWNNDCYGPELSGVVTIQLGGAININTTSGVLKLLDSGLNVIDRVDYGGTGLNPDTNFSIERKILGFDTVSGDAFDADDFEVRRPSTAGFAIPSTQNVIINEFLINDGSAGQGKDWVEIYDKSGSSVDISNWTLMDTTGIFHTFPASTTIASGGFMATADLSNRLSNTGCDKVYLFDNLGNLLDGISYCKMTIPANGTSIGRTTDGAITWSTFLTPTKNAANTSPTANWP